MEWPERKDARDVSHLSDRLSKMQGSFHVVEQISRQRTQAFGDEANPRLNLPLPGLHFIYGSRKQTWSLL